MKFTKKQLTVVLFFAGCLVIGLAGGRLLSVSQEPSADPVVAEEAAEGDNATAEAVDQPTAEGEGEAAAGGDTGAAE